MRLNSYTLHTTYGAAAVQQLKKAYITSARLLILIESKKLEKTIVEFPKQLKACAEAWGRHSEYSQLMQNLILC